MIKATVHERILVAFSLHIHNIVLRILARDAKTERENACMKTIDIHAHLVPR